MNSTYTITLLVFILVSQSTANPRMRSKRGLLSRTGLCPAPDANFQIKDQRLNFYGQAYYLPPDKVSNLTRTCVDSFLLEESGKDTFFIGSFAIKKGEYC